MTRRNDGRNMGDNSGDAHPDVLNGTAQAQLKSVIARIERLNTERDEVGELIKEVFAEAKGNGFDVKTLRKVIAIRKMDRAKRMEAEAILDLYLSAIGELPDFERAAPREEPAEAEDEDYSDIA